MTNPSEKPRIYKITVVKRYSTVHYAKMWQVRLMKCNASGFQHVKFESDDWNKAMTYGNELARIFNG